MKETGKKITKKDLKVLSDSVKVVESARDPIIIVDLEGLIISWNQGAENFYGYSSREVVGKSISILLPDDLHDELNKKIKRIKQDKAIKEFESIRLRKDGTPMDVSLTYSPIKGDDGNIVGFSSIARDISELKKVREDLEKASRYTRSLIEASQDPLVTISPEGKIMDVNEATIHVTGVSREKLVGSDFSSYFTDPKRARAGYEHVFKEGKVTDYELEILGADGRVIPVSYNASVYLNEKGQVEGVFGAARDMTDLKIAQDELQKASKYTRSLIEANIDPLVTISPEGKITDVNEATVMVTGVEREKLLGTDFSNYFTDPERARAGYRQVFKDGMVQDYELEIENVNGKITPVSYNASVYRDEKGEVVGVFAAARDITDLISAEKALSEAITPVMKVWDGILMLPLVGAVDSRRAQVVMETMLTNVMENRIKVAILDVMGVPIVDSAVAGYLVKVIKATRLMGCESIISGISPAVAQTMVNLGLELGDVTSTTSLADALELAFEVLNLEMAHK